MFQEKQPGESIYFRAMARGGGNVTKQARSLLALDNQDFSEAIQFVAQLINDPEKFKYVANTINEVHAAINIHKPDGARKGPIDVTADRAIVDMEAVICDAAWHTKDVSRSIKLALLAQALNALTDEVRRKKLRYF